MQMLVQLALFLAAPGMPTQDQAAPDRIAEDVELLRSDDIRLREAAQERLSELPVSRLPQLRGSLEAESDPEAEARLGEAVWELSTREADRLLREGNIDEALSWLSGEPDPCEAQKMVSAIKVEVTVGILALLPRFECTEQSPGDYAVLANSIIHEFGAWGIAVLFDALSNEQADIPAVLLLQEVGDEVVPCLARALAGGPVTTKRRVLAVLYAMSFDHDRLLTEAAGLRRSLSELSLDRAADGETQRRCQYVLGCLRSPVCPPEAEASATEP